MTERIFTLAELEAARVEALAAERERCANIMLYGGEDQFQLGRACVSSGLSLDQSISMIEAARAPGVTAQRDADSTIARIAAMCKTM